MHGKLSTVFSSTNLLVFAVACLALAGGMFWTSDPDLALFRSTPATAQETDPAATAADKGVSLSDAERIGRLQKSIDADKKYLQSLQSQLNNPENEFHWAEKNFQKLDTQRGEARQNVLQLKAAGKLGEAADLENASKELEERWQKARDRFNLAIKEHKTLEATIAALQRKIQDDQQALDRLTNLSDAPSPGGPTPAPVSSLQPPAAPQPSKPVETPPSLPSLLTVPDSPAALVTPAASSTPAGSAAAPPEPVSREVLRAREEAKVKEEEARKAELKAQSLSERIRALQANIALARKLLETARQRADQEQQTKAALDAELQHKMAAKANEAALQDVSRRVQWSQKRFQDALDEVRSTTDRLHDLQGELNAAQADQIAAMTEAEKKKQAAEAAEDKVTNLQNPFRPRNILVWVIHHGPGMALVAVGMLLSHRLARVLSRRLVVLVAQTTGKRGTHQDRENRAHTLVGVFSSAASLVILGGGSLMLLEEMGIPIVPLMGGAAVFGLAVAFGAQNLIKDYFSGFMVLLEDQYGINDVVRIGTISGLVEHISLRTTVLRDLEGVVHFIPHGTITTVSNLTHGWSRALFDVGVAYKEDADRVMQLLLDLGHELCKDPTFGPLILEGPEMLGVDDLADSSVVIKFFLKTLPLQQWTVKREMLRRIKKRFDELGIEIPFPHQTIYHRFENVPPALQGVQNLLPSRRAS
jgi:small-conductance mechanosensitive channel